MSTHDPRTPSNRSAPGLRIAQWLGLVRTPGPASGTTRVSPMGQDAVTNLPRTRLRRLGQWLGLLVDDPSLRGTGRLPGGWRRG